MKKFIFMLLVAFASVISMNAEQMNYAGKSNFGDNWSVSLQGGVVTPFDKFFDGHTMMTPIAVVGVDKYVTPVVGFGADFRTAIGTGSKSCVVGHNLKTAFDMLNASGYVKFNLTNLFCGFDGSRRLFEPVVYTGLGWGHCTSGFDDLNGNHKHANYMTWRSGCEFNFNLGEKRAWAIVVNPSVVWGSNAEGCEVHHFGNKLNKHNGFFEATAGVVYHFETSNGTHAFTTPILRDQAEIDELNEEINGLREQLAEKPTEIIRERIIEKVVEVNKSRTEVVNFAFDSAELSDNAKRQLTDLVNGGVKKASIKAFASPEGSNKYNLELSHKRAHAVAEFLQNNGVEIVEAVGLGAVSSESNRIAIVIGE